MRLQAKAEYQSWSIVTHPKKNCYSLQQQLLGQTQSGKGAGKKRCIVKWKSFRAAKKG